MKLRRARVEAGLTQAALAERLNCSKQMVTSVETGTRNPSLELLRGWASACGRRLEIHLPPASEEPDEIGLLLTEATAEVRDVVRRILALRTARGTSRLADQPASVVPASRSIDETER